MRRTLFALESDMVVGVATDPSDMLESAAEATEIHDTIVQASDEVVDMQMAVEEGVEGADTLASTSEVLCAAKAAGGADENLAAMAEVTIESIRNRLGFSKSLGAIPSTESFKGPRARVEATRIAVESIGDTIKKVWDNIIQWLKAMAEKIKMFFVNLLKNYSGLETHLGKVKTAAAAVKPDAKMTNENIDKPSLAKFFSIDGKANMDTTEATLKTVMTFTMVSDKIMGFIAGKIGDIKIDSTAKVSEAISDYIASLTDVVKSSGVKVEVKGEDLMMGPLPGNDFAKFVADDAKKSLSMSFEAGKDPAKTIKALTGPEAVKLLEMAIAETKKGDDLRKMAKASEQSSTALLKAAQTVLNSISKLTDDNEGVKVYKDMAKLTSSVSSIVQKLSSKLPSLHYSTLKMIGDYAAASVSNYKPAEKKSDDKK